MASRPLAASRRNPLTVMEPSGYSSAAATSRRNGASSAIWSRGGNVGTRAMVRKRPHSSTVEKRGYAQRVFGHRSGKASSSIDSHHVPSGAERGQAVIRSRVPGVMGASTVRLPRQTGRAVTGPDAGGAGQGSEPRARRRMVMLRRRSATEGYRGRPSMPPRTHDAAAAACRHGRSRC
jgi:hypothetical protein